MGKRGPARSPLATRQAGRHGERGVHTPASGRPPCPAWLSAEAKAEWRRVAPLLDRLGVLSTLDQAALAGYCHQRAEWERYTALVQKHGAVVVLTNKAGEKYAGPSPYVKLANDAYDRMVKAAQQFGFTPAARCSLVFPAQAEAPWVAPAASDGTDPRDILRFLNG